MTHEDERPPQPAGLDDELDFPARVEQVPRFIAALRRECARPQHGQVAGLIAMAETLRRWERPITDALPWSTFSDDDLLVCMGDFAAFRVSLERTFGPEGDAALREGLGDRDAATRSHIKADLFIVTAGSSTDGVCALRLDMRGPRSGRELAARQTGHVGRHLLEEELTRRLAGAPAGAQALAAQIVQGFSAEAARTAAEARARTVDKLAWKKVPKPMRERLLDEDGQHFKGRAGALRHLVNAARFLAGESDTLSARTTDDLVKDALAGKFNGLPQAFAHRLVDYGRTVLGGADDVFNPIGGRDPRSRTNRPLIVEFKTDAASEPIGPEEKTAGAPPTSRRARRLPWDGSAPLAPPPDHAADAVDLQRFLAQHREHRHGAECAGRIEHDKATVDELAEDFAVSRPTIYAWIERFRAAFRAWREGRA